MRIGGRKQPAPQILQFGMRSDACHHELAQTAPTPRFQDKDVGEIGEARTIADDSGKTDLPFRMEETEAERVFHGTHNQFTRDTGRPIRAHKETVNHVEIHSSAVCAYRKAVA